MHEFSVFKGPFFGCYQITCTKPEKATEFTLGREGAGDEGQRLGNYW